MSANNTQEEKICIMCGQRSMDGIIIYSGFICNTCEKEIVKTDVKDEKYPFFIQRMKDLWVKNA